MGRLSNLEILKNKALKELNKYKSRLNPKTFTSYSDRIKLTGRKDVLNKILFDLNKIESISGNRLDKKQLENPLFAGKSVVDSKQFYNRENYEYDYVRDFNDYYKAIRDAVKKNEKGTQYVIMFFRNSDNDVLNRSISIDKIEDGFLAFKKAYDEIVDTTRNKTQYGSDTIDEDEYALDLNNFHIVNFDTSAEGNGESDKMMFKTVGIEQSKKKVGSRMVGMGDCGKQCLMHIIDNDEVRKDLIEKDLREFVCLDGIKNFIEKWNLNIDIIANSYYLKRRYIDILNDGEKKRMTIKDSKGKYRFHLCSRMKIERDIEIVYLHKVDKPDATIIYDEFNKHYDVIEENNIRLCDNVYMSAAGKVIKDEKIIFIPKQLNINNKGKPENNTENKFVIFDYETVIDFTKSSCMKEYSLSILVLNDEQLEELTNADENNDLDKVKYMREKHCISFLGYDCSYQLIKWILDNQANTAFTFIGFNNANFDNFILLDALLRFERKDKDKVNLSNIFYNGSQLLNFTLNGRHNTFDIHKHLMGSLANNCKSFKINCCAKKSFDHHKAQMLYEGGELLDFITDNDELKEYNEYDVLATGVLFCKYRRALANIEATKGYAAELHNIKTVGSLIYKVFEESKKKKEYNLPKLTYEQYSDLQRCKIAGRVELFNGVQKVKERLVSTDVCSLYPYVMGVAPVYYPCGEIIETNCYMGDDILGFYYCDIDQSNLRGLNLPKIYAKKTEIENDWGHEEVLENYLVSNVIIGLLKKFNCKVEIKKGFYFTEKRKSCDMFDFLLDFMKAKNEQDTLNKIKDKKYNPALRETLKLLMNSLSGKVIEGLHTEKTVDVDSVVEYEKIKQKAQSINFINTVGGKLFITYEVDAESICHRSQRPIYLGVLIYDYAKRYMYENSYSKVGLNELLYTDTDASKFRYSRFLEWKNWVDTNNVQVPHWEEVEKIDSRYKNHKIYESDSKVFGSFEDELSEMVGNDYIFYCVEKKSWCYSVDGHAKFRFKGLNGSALLLSLGEDFITQNIINHKSKNEVEVKYSLTTDTQKKVYLFANHNKHLAIGNGNEVKFFEQIYTKKEAYVLCSSFRKIVKNSKHNVVLGQEDKYNSLMNKIQVNFMLKHINLKK